MRINPVIIKWDPVNCSDGAIEDEKKSYRKEN